MSTNLFIKKKESNKKPKIDLKKYNWLIVSGNAEYGINYADIINNKTKEEMGRYVKDHIKDLYDHFNEMLRMNDDGGNIWGIMQELGKNYGNDFFDPNTEEELEKCIEIISEQLEKINDYNIVDDFYAYGYNKDFVRINQLNKKMAFLVVHGDENGED